MQGSGTGYGFYLNGLNLNGLNNVTIRNTNIGGFVFGVGLYHSSNNTVSRNDITNNTGPGIELGGESSGHNLFGNNITNNDAAIKFWSETSGNIVSGNTITSNSNTGVWLTSSSNNVFFGNNITDNSDYGVWLEDSPKNLFRDNSIASNGYNFGVTGSELSLFQDVDESNTVNGKPIYYLVNRQNIEVPSNAGYVALVNSYNITVEGLELRNNYYGVALVNTTNSQVRNNSITNNDEYGVYLDYSSSYNTVSENNIRNNHYYGLKIGFNSPYNDVNENNITDNNGDAAVSIQSSYNVVSRNNITNNGASAWLYGSGVTLSSSSYNNISANDITNNGYGAFYSGFGIVMFSSSHNVISINTIRNNDVGVGVLESSHNVIFHNNFIHNGLQVDDASWYDPEYTPSFNTWDDGYPSGGNYWSDYNGTDSNHDGIGDSNYTIDANNNDRYPLMGMFTEFNATLEQHVQAICNSTISDFQFNGTAISFNVTGDNDTAGFCRICIPTALMNATYKVFVNGTEVSYNLLPCSNETHSYLYLNYTHSTQEVIVIPEFPLFFMLPLFMIATLLSGTIYSRKKSSK